MVVVGPPGDVPPRARVTREEPPGSGPLAGIGAGLDLIATPMVCVLAADMPFAVPVLANAATRLATAAADHADPTTSPTRPPSRSATFLPESREERSIPGGRAGQRATADPADVDAVVPVDPGGFAQPLCAAYRTDALRRALAALQPLPGRPVRDLLPLLRVMEWSVPAAELADVDTEQDLVAARARAAEEGTDMQEWVDAVRAALGLDVTIDIDAVLDAARDAAHAVARPAAPVTTYLLGAAVAGGADPKQAAATIAELAAGWTQTPSEQ